ncbi:MAG: cupin [Chromatiales bacterium 21-64-14]|nr:MAG: cupin [Chromatiales bacterium 21-64-14]HQU16963.1 cupin domain-containing protein [Gammaproteobacteria bacterium]
MNDSRVVRPDPGLEHLTPEGCYILESWNDPGDPELSIARARVAPGATTRLHRLRGVQERYLIVTGRGRVWAGDHPPAPVNPGDVVVIPPGVAQRIANTGDCDLMFYALCTPRFTPDCYEDIDPS